MLHPLAKDRILRITAGFDAETTKDFFLAFFGRIRAFDDLCARTSRRGLSQDDIDRMDLPLVLGGTEFRRPSVCAMEWLRIRASEWWGGDARLFSYAVAYACAHRDKDLAALWSRPVAELRVRTWAKMLRVGDEALRRVASALLPPPDDSARWLLPPDDGQAPDGSPFDLARAALDIVRKFGGSIDHWLWEVSNDDFFAAFLSLFDEADAAAGKDARDNPASWWRIHRNAVIQCGRALQKDAKEWLARRNAAGNTPPEPAADPEPGAPQATDADDTQEDPHNPPDEE